MPAPRETGRRARPAALPVTPGSLRDDLRAGVAGLGLALEETALDKLLAYLALLGKWNAVYNLTAIRDPEAMLVQHLFDSLAIVEPLASRARFQRIVDVGSGAGLPGIVLAIVWPASALRLVEPAGKKAAFLRQCVAELGLERTTVHDCRIEELTRGSQAPDLIVCRAFASLADFVAGVDRLASGTTIVAAMKGRLQRDEIAQVPPPWRVSEAIPLAVPRLDAQRHLLLMERAGAENRPV